jgi:subtilisin family serine protease
MHALENRWRSAAALASRAVTRSVAGWFVFACLLIAAGPAGAAAPDGTARAKSDPRVIAAFDGPDGAPVPVWVEFADRGERDAAELAARLAGAEARLTPANRARRLRAHVVPLVDVRDLPVHEPYLDALRSMGLAPHGVSRWFNHAAVRVDAGDLNRVAALPFVRRVHAVERAMRPRLPEPVGTSPAADLAPRFGLLLSQPTIAYGRTLDLVNHIQAAAVHDSGYIGTGVLVCVLDSGFNGWNTHQTFATLNVPAGHVRDFVQGDFDVTGGFGFDHGGWVLGCVAGNRPGDYVGTGFGATFALGRTENGSSETPAEMTYWMQGAEWADSLGADLISSSLGYSTFDNPADSYTVAQLDGKTSVVSRAAQIAASKGILLVNSAGNEGSSSWRKVLMPADVDGDSLIAVGAVNLSGVRASFSSMGPTADGRIKPDLMADGSSVPLISTSNPTGYTAGSGTSFSAPILAGLAACLIQARPSWTPTQVIRALRETADRWLSPDTLYGYGIPNGLAALRWPASVASVPAPVGFPQIGLIGPNPFRSDGEAVRVRFALNKDAERDERGDVRVVDVQGREVIRLWSGTLRCGDWVTVAWDGRGPGGAPANAGIYFIALDVAGYQRAVRVAWLP